MRSAVPGETVWTAKQVWGPRVHRGRRPRTTARKPHSARDCEIGFACDQVCVQEVLAGLTVPPDGIWPRAGKRVAGNSQ